MKNSKGFTLIELLVVIAIIGVLSSIVLANVNNARARGRDAKRKAEMISIQTALEMYYLDHGNYPIAFDTYHGYNTVGCGVQGTLTGASGYIPDLAPQYIPTLPYDPLNINGCWNGYLYKSDGTNYKLLDHGLPESYPASGNKFYDTCRPTWSWQLTNNSTVTNNCPTIGW